MKEVFIRNVLNISPQMYTRRHEYFWFDTMDLHGLEDNCDTSFHHHHERQEQKEEKCISKCATKEEESNISTASQHEN